MSKIYLTVELPRVGTHGFGFPFPYLCGEKDFEGRPCWRLSHHRGMHHPWTGRGVGAWSSSESITLINPDDLDRRWLYNLARLFRPKTERDHFESMCRQEVGHDL